ncbi:RAM signaling pathway protein-domain-containing protein [Dipodascopsis tothii]|uniref:RAM signaling pathway protein-domain-containing protein n=1 Tax=Dipodascopsis tothii TaxID=44089 RepID=UPI0034CDB78B
MVVVPMERSRSNSESTIPSRAAKRMGFIARMPATDLSTVDESPPTRHVRGVSHDSVMEVTFSAPATVAPLAPGSTINSPVPTSAIPPVPPVPAIPPMPAQQVTPPAPGTAQPLQMPPTVTQVQSSAPVAAPAAPFAGQENVYPVRVSSVGQGFATEEPETPPSAYFRRLSVLQEQIADPVSISATYALEIVEAARGILFAVTQVVPSVRQFIKFGDDKKLKATLTGILHNIQLHVEVLLKALEIYDSSETPMMESLAVEPILTASLSCIGAFRHMIGLLYMNIRPLANKAEVRHTRSLVLLLYGSLCEVNNCWEGLKPALAECRTSVVSYLRPATTSLIYRTKAPPPPAPNAPPMPAESAHITPGPMSAGPTPSALFPGYKTGGPLPPLPIGTPTVETTAYNLHYPLEPADPDEQLYDRLNLATLSALQVLALLNEGIAKVSFGAEPDHKIHELSLMCDTGLEITSQLRQSLKTVRGANVAERNKFSEETNAFFKAVINVLEFTKVIMNEYPFLSDARMSLSTLTRVTKEVLKIFKS